MILINCKLCERRLVRRDTWKEAVSALVSKGHRIKGPPADPVVHCTQCVSENSSQLPDEEQVI